MNCLQIIDGKVPGCPKLHIGFVDVRDVAAAHILAMQNQKPTVSVSSLASANFGSKSFQAF